MSENAGVSARTPARVAMISMHTSPLETPGVGDAGGLNVYVSELACRLGARGVGVDVYTRRTDPDTAEVTGVGENVRVLQVPAGPAQPVSKEKLPALVDEFASWVSAHTAQIDLVHSHYWLSGLAGMRIATDRRVPLVHTMHTIARVKNESPAVGQAPEPGIREAGEADIVGYARVLTANTPDERSALITHYQAGEEQIRIVPPGVDLATFHPCDRGAARHRRQLDPQAKVIVFVGRLQPLKAPDVLISAVADLIDRRPQWRGTLRLIIAGSPSGPERGWADGLSELIVKHRLTDQVQLRPHAPRDELFGWYCAADLVAVPSYNESFGLVALEAQACGRPVVATDVGGLRHAVRDRRTGLLVGGHEPAVWADACETILDDAGLAADYGRDAAIHAARFSWDNTAAATLACYALALTRE
jgi:D-inositol-3-phosphate glycosyltransferase